MSSRRAFLSKTSTAFASLFLFDMQGSYLNLASELIGHSNQLPQDTFHLTARPWQPSNTSARAILDAIEGICRFSIQHQNDEGAIIDPFLDREHQYATPYFAHALGTLLHAGRASDLLEHGIRAMDHATRSFEQGHRNIPDGHGEFFIAPLTAALPLYKKAVHEKQLEVWRRRLSVDVKHVIKGIRSRTNNWRTYPMKGEWLRYKAGLIEREAAVSFIEDGWLNRSQRERIAGDEWNLYQDWSSHRQSHAVEAVGRGNLVALIAAGYDGPSATEIRSIVERGSETSLWLQDPTGQCPPNGRTDNHVFNDVLYQLIFEVMAERAQEGGRHRLAGQYRRAAQLAFQSIQRWKRQDGEWAGSFYVTKNYFDPAKRIGYQPASQYSNYNGAVMYHLAEAFHARQSDIEEQPAPCEIGGFVRAMDPRFGSVVANAGGMQVFLNLKGDTVPKYKIFWTPLGVARFSKQGWDSRLGPSDGVSEFRRKDGVTFGPTLKNGRKWERLATLAEHYEGTLRVDFEHPLIVKFTVVYAPITGKGGPIFYHDFVVTPDGVLSSLSSPHESTLGITLPLLENDGRALEVEIGERAARTRYPASLGNGDEQHFLVVNRGPVKLEGGKSIRSTYGWIKPVRVTTVADQIKIFTYPRTTTDPTGEAVLESFELTELGFRSVLGRLEDSLYVGRFSAGGYGDKLDMNGDGVADLVFDKPCGFITHLYNQRVTAIEVDREVNVEIYGEKHTLQAFTPVSL